MTPGTRPAAAVARPAVAAAEVDSPYAWLRLGTCLLLCTFGGAGMWAVVVMLPAVQQDFGVARASASLPYTLAMLGFGISGILFGKLSDRRGIVLPVLLGSLLMCTGFALAAATTSITEYALVHGLLIGVGSAATFSPLLAHVSQWFRARRATAVGIVASGNYVAGAFWPPVIQHFLTAYGWRPTCIGIAVACLVVSLPLLLLLRRPPPAADHAAAAAHAADPANARPLGLSPAGLQGVLVVAGIACCVAMSMPQVHLVAYCGDLGYGPARGAQMLSLMLACGVVSRLAFGVLCDRIGGLRTLIAGSILQGVALALFLPFDGLVSLYVISALFGLFQGGIVPAYAIIIREYFPPAEAGARTGVVIMATLVGMAFGGWMSGQIFDWTGSYKAAFVNGLAWNLVNVSIASFLLWRATLRPAAA